MRDITILGWSVLVIMGGVCIAVAIAFYCWATGSDDPLDEDPDWDRAVDHCGWVDCPEDFGRVPQAEPGSTRFAPGTGCAVSASGNDPIARGEG